MKILLSVAMLLMSAQMVMAQSSKAQLTKARTSSTRTKINKTRKSSNVFKGDYRLNLAFNNSRISGNFGDEIDQNKLREPGFEISRIFQWKGLDMESGLAYETLGGKLNSGGANTEIKISYLTVPLMVRNDLGRIGSFKVIGRLGGQLAIQSKAEAKAQGIFGGVKDDMEEIVEEYDLRAAIGVNLENQTPGLLGFSTGLQWQRGQRNIFERTGPKLVTDTLAFNVGLLF